jgi:hypothetical protein
MARPALEVADIDRAHGAAYRENHAGDLSLGQLEAMAAIERCRTGTLGGRLDACQDCGNTRVPHNSCRNCRHCPKYQGAAARDWLGARQADTLAVSYYHQVLTLPAPNAEIVYQKKAAIYANLFKATPQHLRVFARSATPSAAVP